MQLRNGLRTAAVISSVHPRSGVPYPLARLCNRGWGRVNSMASGRSLAPEITEILLISLKVT